MNRYIELRKRKFQYDNFELAIRGDLLMGLDNKETFNMLNEREMFFRKRVVNELRNKIEAEFNEEIEYINKAAKEFLMYGEIVTTCPRCGEKLVCENYEVSYVVKCKKEKCVEVKYRSI